MRRAAAGRRAHVHRRRLQLRRADRAATSRALRRAARHLRRDRAGRRPPRWRRWPPATGGFDDDPGADGAAVAPHLRGADALLQDRHRVPGLAQRPPGPLHDGRRPAERARRSLHLAELFRLADAPALLRDPELAAARMRALLAVQRASQLMTAVATPGLALLSINTATVRSAVDAARGHRRLRAPRHRGDLALARPGGRRGLGAAAQLRPRRRAARSPASAAAACSRRPTARPARRLDDNRRAVDEAATLGARTAWCWSSAACRRARGDLARRARDGRATASAMLPRTRAAPACALAIEPLHPMYAADRACVNTLGAGARSVPTRSADGGVGVAVDVYHVWWDPELERRSRAPAARDRSPIHICDWLVPTRDLLHDRGMMGDGVHRLRRHSRGWSRRPATRAASRSRSSPPRTGGSATGDEVLRDLHRAVRDGVPAAAVSLRRPWRCMAAQLARVG